MGCRVCGAAALSQMRRRCPPCPHCPRGPWLVPRGGRPVGAWVAHCTLIHRTGPGIKPTSTVATTVLKTLSSILFLCLLLSEIKYCVLCHTKLILGLPTCSFVGAVTPPPSHPTDQGSTRLPSSGRQWGCQASAGLHHFPWGSPYFSGCKVNKNTCPMSFRKHTNST